MFFNGKTPKTENCCDCGACGQICPKSAISFSTNSNGFTYPSVDLDKCIDCGLCEKVCPIVNADIAKHNNPGVAYAAVNIDRPQLLASSSGGIFSVIAELVLDKGGIVYGAAFDENMRLRHIGIETKEDLKLLRGSKYLHSRNLDIYTEIRKNLNDNRLVYYVGTGCQVAGLKCFLRKDYDNLICSDILCHGTGTQQVFDSVVKYLENKYHGKVVGYNFRDKKYNGWSCTSSSNIRNGNGKIRYVGFDPMMKAYFMAFIKGANYQEVCYKCPFASRNRTGDITLGDYWGVENYINLDNVREGVSAIIVNSPKGERILDSIKDRIQLYPTTIDDIAQINKTLDRPSERPDDRDTFFEKFSKNPDETLMSYAGNWKKEERIFQLKKFIKGHKATLFMLRKIQTLLTK